MHLHTWSEHTGRWVLGRTSCAAIKSTQLVDEDEHFYFLFLGNLIFFLPCVCVCVRDFWWMCASCNVVEGGSYNEKKWQLRISTNWSALDLEETFILLPSRTKKTGGCVQDECDLWTYFVFKCSLGIWLSWRGVAFERNKWNRDAVRLVIFALWYMCTCIEYVLNLVGQCT